MLHGKVTKPKTVIQPIGKETVDLNLLIRVVHEAIGVIIDGGNLAITVATDHFCHSGVVVDPHGHLRIIEPAPGIVDLFKKQGFGEFGCLKHLNPDSSQIKVFTVQLKFADGLAVHFQLPQFL